MLVIRLQRTGRSGHAMFRIVVQDSRKSAASGKIVAYLGNYDPHSKKVDVNKEKALLFLSNGAQPSDRIAGILKAEGVKLPSWVHVSRVKKSAVKNTEKRRSTATVKPEGAAAEAALETVTEEAPSEAIEAPQSTDEQVEDQAEEQSEKTEEVSEPAEEDSAPAKDS